MLIVIVKFIHASFPELKSSAAMEQPPNFLSAHVCHCARSSLVENRCMTCSPGSPRFSTVKHITVIVMWQYLSRVVLPTMPGSIAIKSKTRIMHQILIRKLSADGSIFQARSHHHVQSALLPARIVSMRSCLSFDRKSAISHYQACASITKQAFLQCGVILDWKRPV
eukprot:scaffold444737_cov47-Prasinocladus_malaysianus.AAC.1